MSSPATISDTGRSTLKQVLYFRDYLDYGAFLQEGDPAKNTGAPLEPEIVALFRDEGIFAALKTLLDRFNSDPADVQAAIKLFNLPYGAAIRAKDLGTAVLGQPDGSNDLRVVLSKVRESTLTARGKELLSQILYVRDYLDYNNFLKEGDPLKGISPPLDPEIVTVFRDQGIFAALKTVLERFNSNLADVQAAIRLFDLPSGSQIKARDLGAALLPEKNDSLDLHALLVKLNLASQPTPAEKLDEQGKGLIAENKFPAARKIYRQIQARYKDYKPDWVSGQIDFCAENILDTPGSILSAAGKSLSFLVNRQAIRTYLSSATTVTFYVKADDQGNLLLGTSPSREWIFFSENFQITDNSGKTIDGPPARELFINHVLAPVFQGVPALKGKTINGSFYYKVTVNKLESGASSLDVAPLGGAAAGAVTKKYALKFVPINAGRNLSLPAPSGGKPVEAKPPVPAITHKTAKSAYKEKEKTARANELVNGAFQDGLKKEFTNNRLISVSGSAVVTLQVSSDGSVAVAGIYITTPLSITFAAYNDQEMQARIGKYLEGLTFPTELRGQKPLIHSLVIPRQ